MFRWYRNAKTCYAFLSDVKVAEELAQSRWFTRGWTLQELVAPATVLFYNAYWQYLGSKFELRQQLQHITSIEEGVLIGGELSIVSVARRMSWAANRQTTRVEDLAYCLIGIFDVNMPLLYGEGRKAFTRLQEEILKVSDDHSLFAWGLPERVRTMQEYLDTFRNPSYEEMHGLFADSPSDFTFSNLIHPLETQSSTFPPIVSNNGVRIELQVKRSSKPIRFAVIHCTMKNRYKYYLGFPILPWGERWAARCGELLAIAVVDLVSPQSDKPYRDAEVLLIKAPSFLPNVLRPSNVIKLAWIPGQYSDYYAFGGVQCSIHASYSSREKTITLSEEQDALHAVIFFSAKDVSRINIFDDIRPIFREKVHYVVPKKDSFITTAKNPEFHYVVAHPSFAVLVGGLSETPWTETVLLLSDDDTDGDFNRLRKTRGNLVQYCTTKKHLISLLSHKATRKPLGGQRYRHQCRQIMQWSFASFSNAFESTLDREIRHEEERRKGLLVDTEVRMVASNLVERSLFLFIEVKKLGDEDQETTRKPDWWTLEPQGW